MLALTAVPASATFESDEYFYAIGNSGGQIQCAKRTSSFSAEKSGGYGVISMTGLTTTHKDIYCANALGLPAGWVLEYNVMHRSDNAVYVDTGWTPNANGASWAQASNPVIDWAALGYSYQAVSYHRALVVGAWQDNVWPSNWRYLI